MFLGFVDFVLFCYESSEKKPELCLIFNKESSMLKKITELYFPTVIPMFFFKYVNVQIITFAG
jgi:hypothetical protein